MNRHIFALLVSLVLSGMALGQSTSFTYQGELRQGGVPVTGPFDLRLKLFDAATNGTQIGSTICVNNVQVAEGKFTAMLDFGQQFTAPAPRFLEITVRPDIGQPCTDDFGYITLSPRQQLTATPLALQSRSAFSLAAADGSPSSAVMVNNDGKVGIGTATPTHSVHVAMPEPTLALQDTDSSGGNSGQQVGYLSYRDSANTERGWIGYGSPGDPDLSIINARPSGDIVMNTFGGGNVGIGTPTPTVKLEVHGDIKLGNSGELFAIGGSQNLSVIRGRISSAGSVQGGAGFGCNRLATGFYEITFDDPFVDVPTVTASIVAISNPTDKIISVSVPGSGGNARAYVLTCTVGGQTADSAFNFIVIGRR